MTGQPGQMRARPFPAGALDDRLAIVGTSGSGKTYAAKGLVERVAGTGARLCIVDPLGVWFGLRAGPDGLADGGLPILILGGKHADVPLREHDGEAIGRLVGTRSVQCVIDLAGLDSKSARIRFMRAFLEALYEANTEPLHLVLDEADLWAPQRPQPDQTVLQNRVGEIVRRGRVRGFIPWLITQRPAVLDKDVLSQADVLVAMKLTSSQDRNAIAGWVDGQAEKAAQRELLAALPRLPRGSAYVWAPGLRFLHVVAFPPISTFDSSRTPARGRQTSGPSSLTPVDAAAVRELLAAPREASQVAGGGAADPDAYKRGFEAGARAERENLERELAAAREELLDTQKVLMKIEEALQEAPSSGGRWRMHSLAASPMDADARDDTPQRPAPALGAAAKAMLLVLAMVRPRPLTWRQVAILGGLAARGGHWNSGRKQLRDLELFYEVNDGIMASPDGLAAVGDPPAMRLDPGRVLAMWEDKLPNLAGRMLRRLVDDGPLPRLELASRLGVAGHGGHWNTALKALRDAQLVVEGPERLEAVAEVNSKIMSALNDLQRGGVTGER